MNKSENTILKLLICPDCKSPCDIQSESTIICTNCQNKYPLKNNVPVMFDANSLKLIEQELNLSLGRTLKKKSNRWLAVAHKKLKAPSPTLIKKRIENLIELAQKENPQALILEIGSGNHHRKDVINLDIQLLENVDLVADVHNLPIASKSIDAIIAATLLEHTQNPLVVFAEIKRVLKPGGYVYLSVPFCYPYHAAPCDYWRASMNGLEYLCNDFDKIETGTEMGPASVFSVFLRTFLATLFSWGNYAAYRILLEVFGWLTFPIKYLDLLLRKFGNSHMDGVIFFIGRTKS